MEDNNAKVIINGAVITPELAEHIKHMQKFNNDTVHQFRNMLADVICEMLIDIDLDNKKYLDSQRLFIDLAYLREFLSKISVDTDKIG